jgi:hypothetical protein
MTAGERSCQFITDISSQLTACNLFLPLVPKTFNKVPLTAQGM